jgi:hypothetical protein
MRGSAAILVPLTVALSLLACGGQSTPAPLANGSPRARLAAPLYAPIGEPVTFDANASYDPDGAVVEYTFSFSDGTRQVTLPVGEAQHTFQQPGAYEVAVVVRDDGGLLSRATQLVVVRTDPPQCAAASDCSLGAECRADVHLCYANGPGAGFGEAECQTDAACGTGLSCRSGLCLAANGPGAGTP